MASEGSKELMRGAVVVVVGAQGVKTQPKRGPKSGRRGREENGGRSAVVSRIKWHAESCGRYN